MQVKEALEEFHLEIIVRGYAESTVKIMTHNVNQFIKFVGDKELSSISKLDVKKFIVDQQSKGLKATCINQRLKNLGTYFLYCIQEDYLKISPA